MRVRSLLLCTLLSGMATTGFGAMITQGTFNIAGQVFVTGTGGVATPAGFCPVGFQCFIFEDTSNPPVLNKADISAGGLPNGDIPLAIAGNDAANISNLINPPEIVGPPGFAPTLFLSFNNAGITTQLLANFIALGINGAAGCAATPAAAGQICSPPGSPINFQNLTATSSSASFRMSGVTNDSSSTWTATLTSQFNTQSYQDVLAAFAANGFVENTFAGSVTLVAPEPGTTSFLLLGSIMIGCATLLRRVARR